MANLADMLTESAARHGDRTALRLDEPALSYDVLEQASARFVPHDTLGEEIGAAVALQPGAGATPAGKVLEREIRAPGG
jgi:non-ribosomal peptide synthetase component E (peptide arylation enzyme)